MGGHHNAAECRHQDNAAAAQHHGVFGGFGAHADEERVAERGGGYGGRQQRVRRKAAVQHQCAHADFGQQVTPEQQHAGKLQLVNQKIRHQFRRNQPRRARTRQPEPRNRIGLPLQSHHVGQRYHDEKHTENQPSGHAVLNGVGLGDRAAARAQVVFFQHRFAQKRADGIKLFGVFFVYFLLDVLADGGGQFFVVDCDAAVVKIGIDAGFGVMLLQHAFHRRQPRRLGIGRDINLQGFAVGELVGGTVGIVQNQLETPVVQTALRVVEFFRLHQGYLNIIFCQTGGKLLIDRIVCNAHQRDAAAVVRVGIAAQRDRHNQHKRNRHHEQNRQTVQVAAEQFQFFNKGGGNHGCSVSRRKKSK